MTEVISKLGKYVIRRELGKGAMGVVYEGFDPFLERTVAIKTIKPQQLVSKEAADVLARFKREAQSAARLNHPGIVAVYEYGEAVPEDDRTMVATQATVADQSKKVAYIAMEFVKGRELRDYFEANERFSLPDVARLMGDILAALGHAHANGVTHRDIKPANLIVLDDGRIKIADFGIARVEKSELTQAGAVMGTPQYMSPEQFLGQPVDGRSDLFSCGVVLYQFLTGEKPFTGNTTTIMYKVLQEEPLAPSKLNVGLPGAFDSVMQKAIAKNPGERFQTAAEFAAAIHAAVTGTAAVSSTDATSINATVPPLPRAPAATAAPAGGSARGTGQTWSDAPPGMLGGTSPPQATPATPPPAPARAGSNKAVIGAVVGGVVLVAAAVGGWALLGNKPAGSGDGQVAPAVASTGATAAPAPARVAARETPPESGFVTISAVGLANPNDPKFKGDLAAAQAEAQADARRQLVEKALGMYVEPASLNKNYAVIEKKLLSQSGSFIKTMLQEPTAPSAGKDGLVASEARAEVKSRDLQKSLNQLSKEERIDFIRNNGDPKVAIQMTIANADTGQNFPPMRSQVAENVVKERIKSFGFRVWSNEGETATGANARAADFVISGEAKVKQLSAKLQASGVTITKTVLTSWTVKAIDKASGEEIYLNTVMPKGESWGSEDAALADIGRFVGEEFSKNFFLTYFNVGVRQTSLDITGLPDAQTATLLLRELRGVRQVLDVQPVGDKGKYKLVLAENSPAAIAQDAIVKPLNAKLGKECFAVSGTSDAAISISFSPACADIRAKLETTPPAGLQNAAPSRVTPLLQGLPTVKA